MIDKSKYVLGRIYIDNFEDLSSTRDTKALSNVETVIIEELDKFGAVTSKGNMGRYTFYIEYENLNRITAGNFEILDKARDIKAQNGLSITLSIAVGVSSTSIQNASKACYQSMELVLGRGGDQAIIKSREQYHFYGGKYQPREKYSKVRVRVFAKSLRKLMEQYDRIIVSGHSMPDYDSFGAMLGIVECALSMGKKTQVVIDEDRLSIERIFDLLKDDEKLSKIVISPEKALEICDSHTMLVVCDTQRQDLLPAPELVNLAGVVSVIDHHRRSVDSITSALDFIQVSASSTCEMVSEITSYFSYNMKMSTITATALLSGILVDTKNFSVNTSSRTFESAAYLRKKGADDLVIQSIFKDSFDLFLVRAAIIKKAGFPFKNIAVCAYKGKHERLQVLAAQACDILTAMQEIKAAFVLTKRDKRIFVSARSSGDFNCQRVLEYLGGGGHFNVAGVQIKDVEIDVAEEMIISAIEKYLNGELDG